MTETDRILIVEDDTDMARALAEACSELGYSPVLETTCAAGLATAKAGQFPLAILDRMMPDGDSIDMLAELRHAGTIGAILMVSALAHAGHRSHGLDRGADDYLAKPFAPEELRARIRALVRRTKAQPTDNDFLVFDGLEIRVKALMYFATHAGTPLSRMQLLEHVWNLHFDPQTNVVDVHVGRLRRKLEQHTDRAWIHTARGAGYWFGPEGA